MPNKLSLYKKMNNRKFYNTLTKYIKDKWQI